MKRFADSGLEGLKNLPRAGRPSEVSEEKFAEIKRELSENLAGWRAKEIMNEKTGVRYHEVHIYRLLHKWKFSPKVPRKRLVNAQQMKKGSSSNNEQGHPKNIFIISDALPAVPGRALDQIAERLYKEPNQQFLKGALMPFLGFSPWLQKLVTDNRIECYGWPIGVTAYWFREIGSGRPGLLTKIGVDTFLDPRQDSAALNELARGNASCHVSVIDIDGEDYLLYQAPKPNYAMIRASVSDENGNLSLQDEGMKGTVLSITQSAKAGGPNQGMVIAQVRWITKSGTINPRDVDVPGPLVNYIVVSPKEYHWQCGSIEYDPRLSYKIIPPARENLLVDGGIPKISLGGYKKVIARRILLELIRLFETKRSPVLVNLGIGIPALISLIAAEENITDFIITVLESGPWGGLALTGNDFGLAISPFALSTIPDVFSNFEGGIIDASIAWIPTSRQKGKCESLYAA